MKHRAHFILINSQLDKNVNNWKPLKNHWIPWQLVSKKTCTKGNVDLTTVDILQRLSWYVSYWRRRKNIKIDGNSTQRKLSPKAMVDILQWGIGMSVIENHFKNIKIVGNETQRNFSPKEVVVLQWQPWYVSHWKPLKNIKTGLKKLFTKGNCCFAMEFLLQQYFTYCRISHLVKLIKICLVG